jgi:hypothetical protein
MEFNLSGHNLNTGAEYNVRFVYNFKAKQVKLGHSIGSGKVATFHLCEELYLGKVYTPKLKIGSDEAYLEHCEGSIYNLVNTPNSKCFNFTPSEGLEVIPNNFPVSSPLILVSTGRPITINSNEVCPENFTLINGQCATQMPINAAFGIRVRNEVYTYSIVGNSLVARLVPQNRISSKYETATIFRERWFFADYAPGQSQLSIGQRYPLYVFVGNNKHYITNPVQSGTNVIYQLSCAMSMNTLTFTPRFTANWGEFSISESEFENFMMPNEMNNKNGSIALWQNKTVRGMPAVVNNPHASYMNSNMDLSMNNLENSYMNLNLNNLNSSYMNNLNYSQMNNMNPNMNNMNPNMNNMNPNMNNLNSSYMNSNMNNLNSTSLCNTVTNPCPAGQYCDYGVCKPAPCNTVTNPCPAGQVCDFGVCKAGCSSTTPCPAGQICSNGICNQPCSSTNPCPTGKTCNNQVCIPTCTSTSCTGGKVCVAGTCQNCSSSTPCPIGQTCQNGSCSVPPPKPWWKTWWFWTIIGVVLFIIFLIILYAIFG